MFRIYIPRYPCQGGTNEPHAPREKPRLICLPRMSASGMWTPLPACSDSESRGRGWLLENMQLLGLNAEDKGRSLFTCVKELFENAVDACQNADARHVNAAHPCADLAANSHNIVELSFTNNVASWEACLSCVETRGVHYFIKNKGQRRLVPLYAVEL